MGLKHREYLTSEKIYGCNNCRTHLSTIECVKSKQFTGQHGRAFLFSHVVNVVEGEPENRSMTTGLHTVKDISCSKCGNLLGWRYFKAFEPSQAYKEGQYILEKQKFTEVH